MFKEKYLISKIEGPEGLEKPETQKPVLEKSLETQISDAEAELKGAIDDANKLLAGPPGSYGVKKRAKVTLNLEDVGEEAEKLLKGDELKKVLYEMFIDKLAEKTSQKWAEDYYKNKGMNYMASDYQDLYNQFQKNSKYAENPSLLKNDPEVISFVDKMVLKVEIPRPSK